MSVVLSEHLPLLASAPEGIQKLRGLILELAVRGKLVPQDPGDEPASELLKRIATERARLEAEGICKKSKPLPPASEDVQSFSVPDGWKWVRLSTIGNIFNGNSINADEKHAKFRRSDGLPYIATKDVGYGLTPLDYDNGIRIPESEPNFKIAHEGAVFVCAEGGSAGKKCGLSDRNVFFGNKLFANEPLAGIPSRFVLYIYLAPFFREKFSSVMTGIIGGVSIAKFVEIAIPLPPLAEQHRIVAKVDELMALCDRLEAEQTDAEAAHAKLVETLLGTLTQSTNAADLAANWQRLAEHFDTLFTTESSLDALKQTILKLAVMGKLVPQDPNDEPASELLKRIADERAQQDKRLKQVIPANDVSPNENVPIGWELVRLEEIIRVSSGDGLTAEGMAKNGTIPVFGGNGINGYHDKANTEKATLVIGRVGFYCGSIHLTPSKAWITDNALRVTFSEENLHIGYLYWLLKTTKLNANDSATAQPLVSGKKIYPILVGVPPLAEQHRIVAKVDELMALCDRLKADLVESRCRQERLAATLIESALEAA